MISKARAGNACELAWVKSSYSGGTDGESCVDVAKVPDTVHVRDSKNVAGPHLHLAPYAWTSFVRYAAAR